MDPPSGSLQRQHEVSIAPASLYQRWYDTRFSNEEISVAETELAKLKLNSKMSIILIVHKARARLLVSSIKSVQKQYYENWELCICVGDSDSELKGILTNFSNDDSRIKVIFSELAGRAGLSNKALAIATGDYVVLLNQEDELSPDALYEVVKAINKNPDSDFIYTDEDKITYDGEHIEPFFKPDWSPDFFLSMNYVSNLCVIKKSLIRDVGGFRAAFEGSLGYDLMLRVSEKTDKIVHIPKVLYNSRKADVASEKVKHDAHKAGMLALQDAIKRRNIDGTVVDGHAGFYRVKYNLRKLPLVSIIILNKNHAKLLKRCIESIVSKSTYRNYEILIVDHSSTDKETLDYLKTLEHKVLKYEGEFNFSRMNNVAAKAANGEHLIILNNDTEVIEPSWIEAMLEYSQREEIGAVGAKLLFPDGSVQHAGIIIGFSSSATNYEIPKNRSGYFSIDNAIRNCSGVTAACIMVRRDVFEEIEGFDEKMAHSWQDVDLCIRIMDLGKRIVYTPHSVLYHITGGTRGRIDQSQEELDAYAYYKAKHKQSIERGDPYYNPNLSLLGEPYVTDFAFITDPIEMLVKIWELRSDLQKAYPEVSSGNYKQLIKWAIDYGIKDDGSKVYLAKFHTRYEDAFKLYSKEESASPAKVQSNRINMEEIAIECSKFTYRPKISVIMPVYNSKVDILTAAVNSIESQPYENWELCMCDDGSTQKETKDLLEAFAKKDARIKIKYFTKNQGISKATNGALSIATGEYIALLDHDDELSPDAMFEIVKALNSDPNIDFLYSDEEKIDREGNHVEPFFKPDFSMHLLRSQNYLIHVAVIRRQLVEDVGRFDSAFDGAQDYDLFFRVLEKTDRVHHIRKNLYYWRKSAESGAENALAKPWIYETGKRAIQDHLKRLGLNATADIGKTHGLYRITYAINDTPAVDILIPTRKISFLRYCVSSILTKTRWQNYKIWAVINGKKDYEIVQIKTKECIELEPHTDPKTGLIGPTLPYNWSRMNNVAAAHTQAPFIILLNDDTSIISEDWIQDMLQYAQQPDIGGVGVMLLYPDDVIQHAGDYIHQTKRGAHCFNGMAKNSFEINGFAQVVRETSAVTSACMMIRREVFNKLGGFDETLRNFDDYDFCLRLREQGYKIIYTPYTQVYHHESPTRPHILEEQMVNYLMKKHPSISYDRFYRYEWESQYDKTSSNLKQRTLEDITINSKSDPLSLLLALYLSRKDLQQAFPEVMNHDYRRLFQWTKKTVAGKYADKATEVLSKFADWYGKIGPTLEEVIVDEKTDPLSVVIGIYLSRPDLQQAFPQVVNHDYKHFLKWAQEVANKKYEDSNSSILIKFADWFNKIAQDENIRIASIPQNITVAIHFELFRRSKLAGSE